jgi:hypothetical protein
MSRCWFAGSTVNTLIRVVTLLFVEIVVMASPSIFRQSGETIVLLNARAHCPSRKTPWLNFLRQT